MGNFRFRLSEMIPNAWFYKLKDMSIRPNKHQSKTTNNPTNNNKIKKHSSFSSSSPSISSSLSSSSLLAPANHNPSTITKNQPHVSDQRKSYYFTRDLTSFHPDDSPTKTRLLLISDKNEPPRKSSRRRRSTKRNHPRLRAPPRLVSSTISAGCSCRATLESVVSCVPEEYENSTNTLDQTSSSDIDSVLTECGSDRVPLTPDNTFDGMISNWSSSSACKCRTGDKNDIVLDIADDHHLPPIITKKQQQQHHYDGEPTKIQRTSAEFSERNAYGSLSVKVVKEDFVRSTKTNSNPIRRFPANSSSSSPGGGVKLRTNSPRIANRRIQGGRKSVSSNSSSGGGGSRRSVSESLAVVKSSKDPRRDFRESMVEMIVENNIRASKDLEELLACYLSLNSDEYHELIINVFKQIWFDFVSVRLK